MHTHRTFMVVGKTIAALFCAMLLSGCFTDEGDTSLQDLQSPNITVKDAAIQRVTADGIAEAAPALLTLLDPRYPIKTRKLAIVALGTLAEPRAILPLRTIIDNNERELTEEAIEALGKIGDPSVRDLLKKLIEDREYAIPAIWAMGKIGGTEATQVLTELLNDPDQHVTYNAYHALIAIKDTP